MKSAVLRALMAVMILAVLGAAQVVNGATNQSGGDGTGCVVIIFAFLLVVGVVVGGFMWLMGSIFGKPKSITHKGYDNFYASLPENYGHKYFNDNTGYAINVLEHKVYLYSGSPKVYSIADIRNVERVWQTPGQVRTVGNSSISSTLQTHGHNVSLERQAYDESGLFISVADIEKPRYQIKFISESDLLRSYEVFLQAMEGKLPPDKEVSESKHCPTCNSDVRESYIEDGSIGAWCPKCNMSLKKMRGEI